MLAEAERRKKIGDVIRVASGNFLEQYDFFVYAYYASYIAKTFFPSGNAVVSLMLTLATFAVGFLMRPLGAVILGAYIDRHGRRNGLILTLGLMATGTLSIAITPGYETLGMAAPLIIVLGRLLQGFSAGAELGGVSVYLAEIATPGHRGFYTSWQSASQQIAVIMASLIGVALTAAFTSSQMLDFGWRIPMLIGCGIIPLILFLRRSLKETEEFEKMKHAHSGGEVLRILIENWAVVLAGMGMSVLTTTTFYLITAYTPTFGREALHLDATGVLIVTLCVGVSNFIWLPIGGALSDKFGRYPLLYTIPILTLLTAYPVMLWLVAEPSFGKLLVTVLLFLRLFRPLQRRDDPHSGGDHAATGANSWLFAGLQPCHGRVRRLHAARLDGAHPGHGQPGVSGAVAVLCRPGQPGRGGLVQACIRQDGRKRSRVLVGTRPRLSKAGSSARGP